jgi:hydrogenase maturation protease
MSADGQLLVLGLGNVLCRDDGVGVAAVTRLLRRYRAPDDVRVLDGGTLGLSLLPYLQCARDVILVDAIAADAPAGSAVRLEGDAVVPAVEQRLSPHQVGVCDLLDGARLLAGDDDSQRIVLLGIVPDRVELGTGLTEHVEAAVDALVEAVVLEAASMGYRFTRDERQHHADGDAGHHAARVLGM